MVCVNPFEFVTPLLHSVSGFRKSGSTAVDLIHLAQGRKSIVLSSGLKPYDIAAGILIAREAGYVITDLKGKSAHYTSDAILAASSNIHAQALKLIPSN